MQSGKQRGQPLDGLAEALGRAGVEGKRDRTAAATTRKLIINQAAETRSLLRIRASAFTGSVNIR
jgi:hypothetical protein